jgi:hypothetical protein
MAEVVGDLIPVCASSIIPIIVRLHRGADNGREKCSLSRHLGLASSLLKCVSGVKVMCVRSESKFVSGVELRGTARNCRNGRFELSHA